MKFEGTGEKQNVARLIHNILSTKMGNEILELEDGYGISREMIEGLSFQLFVKNNSKVLWKAGRTKFTKAFVEEVSSLIRTRVTSFEDMGFLMFLSTDYTDHEDNYLSKNGKHLTKKKLIEDLIEATGLSESYYKKLIASLEKKNLILSEPHPTDKRNKIFYLTPYLFYKGKFMDSKVKEKLVKIAKTVHEDIKKLNEQGEANIELDNEFEHKDASILEDEIIEYLHDYIN